MTYNISRIEGYVQQIYNKLGIRHANEIDMMSIASSFNIWVHYWDKKSKLYCRNGMCSIMINQYDSPQKQWQDFAHEVGHELQHVGSQLTLPTPFVELQEWQANSFMMHFCVPTFMLEEMRRPLLKLTKAHAAGLVAETFNVEFDVAFRRLNMYERKIMQEFYSKIGGY